MTKIENLNSEPKVVLGEKPYIFPNAIIKNSYFGKYTEIANYANISDSSMDDYSYVSEYTQIANTQIGKFANIASNAQTGKPENPCKYKKNPAVVETARFFHWWRRRESNPQPNPQKH